MRKDDDDEQLDKINENHVSQNYTLEQAVLWAMALQEKKAQVEHVQVVVQAVEVSEEVVKKPYE